MAQGRQQCPTLFTDVFPIYLCRCYFSHCSYWNITNWTVFMIKAHAICAPAMNPLSNSCKSFPLVINQHFYTCHRAWLYIIWLTVSSSARAEGSTFVILSHLSLIFFYLFCIFALLYDKTFNITDGKIYLLAYCPHSHISCYHLASANCV